MNVLEQNYNLSWVSQSFGILSQFDVLGFDILYYIVNRHFSKHASLRLTMLGVTSPWNINFISGWVKRHSSSRLWSDFWTKNTPPPPPLRTTHRAAIRKIFDEKDAHDNEDFKTGCKNVVALLVLAQIKK